jgi:quinol monooxygenase YgiN
VTAVPEKSRSSEEIHVDRRRTVRSERGTRIDGGTAAADERGASRAEPGCLEFSVYREIDDPRAFLLYERYTHEEAFQAHRRTPHFGDIIERQVAPLLEVRAWTRVEPLPA